MDAKVTGTLIAARRKRQNLSQAELAERLHVTDKAVSRWETGRGMPGLDSLEPLAETLGLSISELLSGKELTTEELPTAAGEQIMESMKREHQWKWLAWLAMAAVTLLTVWGIMVSAQVQREKDQAEQERTERYAHYASSVNAKDDEALAEATAAYFADRSPRFNAESLKVRERAWDYWEGEYIALLLSDRADEWCMSLWQRDEVYPERYHIIGGRCQIDSGMDGLMVWNFGDAENAIVVVSGVGLPEEADHYDWYANGTSYGRGVNWQTPTVLDIFLMSLPETEKRPFYRPTLYDRAGNYIYK